MKRAACASGEGAATTCSCSSRPRAASRISAWRRARSTVDGVSLTIVGVESEGFDVALIPHTLEVTTLGALAPGERVNLEADVLGKYVRKYLERIFPEKRV